MQKLILPLLLVFALVTQSKAQQRLFDQAVQLKTCNISIEANPFIATTVVEMEFYNPKDQEVEGLHTFQLNRGQVITDFQLELNGKYREGSIEEQWKARQAYSKIVGKRIDPAILQMRGQNYYWLNIYPIAAKSSRKIKFTITQMMVEENLKLSYTLPLDIKSRTAGFTLNIRVDKPASIPYANKGLLEDQLFNMNGDQASLFQQLTDVVLDKPISFSISQFANKPQFCISNKNGLNSFIMRFYPDVARYYQSKTKTINVYWDVSLSGKERNLSKEIDFLEKYIAENGINKTTIFLFNHQLQGLIVFNRGKDDFNAIRNYLLTYKYTGATDLGILNFSNVLADAVLLFSDGVNSIGNAKPKLGAVPVNFITSAYYYYNSYSNYYQYNDEDYKNIVGNTGGSVIRLYYNSVASAVKRIDTAENFLFKYNSGNIHINESFPVKLGGSVLLSGTINQADNLELFYGNNSLINKSENYFIPVNENCDEATYKKMKMLKAYDSLMYDNYNYRNWQNMIVFGLTERVVTPQTSFLVLERIEDYIKYKIAPPKELEEKCAEMNYVYKSEYKIKALKSFTEQEALESVVKDYNKRINWWSKTETLIDLNRIEPDKQPMDVAATTNTTSGKVAGVNVQNNFAQDQAGGLKEVVVTGAFGTKRSARSTASASQYVNGELLNAIRQVNVNDALAGKVAGMQVRSQSAGKLGAENSIRLRGENGLGLGGGAIYVVNGTIMSALNQNPTGAFASANLSSSADINPDDIEDITILQGPAAAALFGPDGVNGAIVINTKKAKKGYRYFVWSEYKLSSAEDEDYVKEMQNAADYELWETFLELEKQNKMNVGFYFEMANFFFEKGKTDKAEELMYDAIELSRGRTEGLKLAAYMYEKWKWFDKAIAVYKGILSQNENNLLVKRDLALAYFQHKNFEAAVKTYYSIITATDENNSNGNVKENALAEMNAILALHKNEFDISYINHNLVKMVPVDLRITVESNYDYNYYSKKVQFVEPDNTKCSVATPNTINKGRYSGNEDYYDYTLSEYTIKDALAGKYRVKVDSYNNYSSAAQAPMFIRVITFKNFQKENMEMEVKIFDLDNQYGVVELDEISW